MELSCSNCLSKGNEPSEGECAGCFRSIGVEEMWQPDDNYIIEDPIYLAADVEAEGC